MKQAYKNNINESVQKVQLKCSALASFVKLVDSSIVKVKPKYLLKPSFIKLSYVKTCLNLFRILYFHACIHLQSIGIHL